MAIALDQGDIGGASDAASDSSIAFNTSATVAAGADIFLLIKVRASATITSVTGGSLTWTQEASGDSGVDFLYLFRATAPSGLAIGQTITANLSTSSPNRIIGGCSFTGLSTGGKVASGGGFGEADATWESVVLATTAAQTLSLTATTMDTDVSNTPNSPTLEAFDKGASFDYRLTMAYRIDSGAGSYQNSGTYGFAGFWLAASAAYAGSDATVALTQRPLFRVRGG